MSFVVVRRNTGCHSQLPDVQLPQYRHRKGSDPDRFHGCQEMNNSPRILYCHCSHAQVVPKEVKEAVLRKLCASNVSFEAVADLCEASARHDPALKRLTDGGPIKIAACYPRAVKWLFAAAKAPLPADITEVLNMRTQSAEEVAAALFAGEVNANLPMGKEKPSNGELPQGPLAA